MGGSERLGAINDLDILRARNTLKHGGAVSDAGVSHVGLETLVAGRNVLRGLPYFVNVVTLK